MPHTPGPWEYREETCEIVAPNVLKYPDDDPQDDPPQCVSVVYLRGAMGGDDNAADIRLIAAAPELLRACEEDAKRIRHLCAMVNDFAAKLGLGNKVHAEDWDDKARAAIARATGESK